MIWLVILLALVAVGLAFFSFVFASDPEGRSGNVAMALFGLACLCGLSSIIALLIGLARWLAQ